MQRAIDIRHAVRRLGVRRPPEGSDGEDRSRHAARPCLGFIPPLNNFIKWRTAERAQRDGLRSLHAHNPVVFDTQLHYTTLMDTLLRNRRTCPLFRRRVRAGIQSTRYAGWALYVLVPRTVDSGGILGYNHSDNDRLHNYHALNSI